MAGQQELSFPRAAGWKWLLTRRLRRSRVPTLGALLLPLPPSSPRPWSLHSENRLWCAIGLGFSPSPPPPPSQCATGGGAEPFDAFRAGFVRLEGRRESPGHRLQVLIQQVWEGIRDPAFLTSTLVGLGVGAGAGAADLGSALE